MSLYITLNRKGFKVIAIKFIDENKQLDLSIKLMDPEHVDNCIEKFKSVISDFHLELVNYVSQYNIAGRSDNDYMYTVFECKSNFRYRTFAPELSISNGSVHADNILINLTGDKLKDPIDCRLTVDDVINEALSRFPLHYDETIETDLDTLKSSLTLVAKWKSSELNVLKSWFNHNKTILEKYSDNDELAELKCFNSDAVNYLDSFLTT